MRLWHAATAAAMVLAVAACSGDSGGGGNLGSSNWPSASASATSQAASAPAQAQPPANVEGVVSVSASECKPPGVPGNCWLPFYPQPQVAGKAFNQSATCSNQSHDQSTCWPQPGTKVSVVCTTSLLPAGVKAYGVRVPKERVQGDLPHYARSVPGSTDLLGFAAANYINIADTAAAQKLPSCNALTG